jgi:hypothetical protein
LGGGLKTLSIKLNICFEILHTASEKLLVGKPERKKLLGRPRRRWEDGIRMDLRETGWGCGLDSTGSQ